MRMDAGSLRMDGTGAKVAVCHMNELDFVFPQDVNVCGTNVNGTGDRRREGGLTKRELFAAMFYAAMISNLRNSSEAAAFEVNGAKGTVALADSLLAELEKDKK